MILVLLGVFVCIQIYLSVSSIKDSVKRYLYITISASALLIKTTLPHKGRIVPPFRRSECFRCLGGVEVSPLAIIMTAVSSIPGWEIVYNI